ncbi:MAG: UDP-N-acetylmuramoyl-L-alanine--D-glutamate ligase [Pontibacterium sp.]
MTLITSDKPRIIIGLGATGVSCARHLARKGVPFSVVDSREAPPGLAQFIAEFPEIDVHTGSLPKERLCQAGELILSPGVALASPELQAALAAGVSVIGDIDLFCREVAQPIIAITGSNAKSTVTSLVGEMAKQAGVNVGVGGNIGLPVLDLLAEGEHELYVLELSSFQLETTHELRAEVATVLNVSPDHQDRYDGMADYHRAKHRIFRGCKHAVINRDDPLSSPLLPKDTKTSSFTLGAPDLNTFGVRKADSDLVLCLAHEALIKASELKLKGQHNISNVLAALAIGHAAGLPMSAMLDAAKAYVGLAHRCEWVREHQGITYINDSKGTNVGATEAALNGFGISLQGNEKLVLIAGGVGKGAKFDDLVVPVRQYCRSVVLIGADGVVIEKALSATGISCVYADSMEDAVRLATDQADQGDTVLLSPACASLDMFKNFEVRGDVFASCVRALA